MAKFGLPGILEGLEEAEELMGHEELDRRMFEHATYTSLLKDFQKKVSSVHKSSVRLDIKTNTWTEVPKQVSV